MNRMIRGRRQDAEKSPGEKMAERVAGCTPARPKDLVVIVGEDEKDSRPSSGVLTEREIRECRFVEPSYGEKLRVGFAMLAGEHVRF